MTNSLPRRERPIRRIAAPAELLVIVFDNGVRLVMRSNGTFFVRVGENWTEIDPLTAVAAVADGLFVLIHQSQLVLEFLLSDKGRIEASAAASLRSKLGTEAAK